VFFDSFSSISGWANQYAKLEVTKVITKVQVSESRR
jgi:hypothetical protein